VDERTGPSAAICMKVGSSGVTLLASPTPCRREATRRVDASADPEDAVVEQEVPHIIIVVGSSGLL
jgi:hypothetical protein